MADRVQHTDDLECSSCNSKLEFAHEYLGAFFRDLKAQYPSVHIAWSFRDKESQNKAYLEGKSKLLWPASKHNHTKNGRGYSLALDLFQITLDGDAVFSVQFAKRVAQIVEENRLEIVCGVNWKKFPDSGHIELRSEIPSKSYKPL